MTWAASNLCRGKPSPPIESVAPIFPFLLNRLKDSDEEAKLDACFAVSYLSDGSDEQIQAILDAGFLPPIIEILSSRASLDHDGPLVPALRAVGNILTGDASQTQTVLDFGIIPILSILLESPKSGIRKETCWALSNITAGTSPQLQMVIDAGIMPRIFANGQSSPEDVAKECLWCIANGTALKNVAHVRYLLEQGLLPYLAWKLEFGSPSSDTLSVVLSTIDNVLKTDKLFHQLVAVDLGPQLETLVLPLSDPDLFPVLEGIMETLQEVALAGSVSLASPADVNVV